MRIGIFLSYKGLGANLLHLSYCHEIAKKHGPISLVTICKNLKEALDTESKPKAEPKKEDALPKSKLKKEELKAEKK